MGSSPIASLERWGAAPKDGQSLVCAGELIWIPPKDRQNGTIFALHSHPSSTDSSCGIAQSYAFQKGSLPKNYVKRSFLEQKRAELKSAQFIFILWEGSSEKNYSFKACFYFIVWKPRMKQAESSGLENQDLDSGHYLEVNCMPTAIDLTSLVTTA